MNQLNVTDARCEALFASRLQRSDAPTRDAVPVTPHVLDGAEREQAWKRIVAAQPRYEKYQRKSDREYPVVRLTPR